MRPELAPGARLAGLGLAYGLLYSAGPGILSRDGSAWLAWLAVALWASFASRPGKRAGWSDFLLGGCAWAGVCSWSAHVWPGNLAIMLVGYGLYALLAGALLRRLVARFPLALAAPAAWMLAETLRAVLPPPLGMPWMRLGTHLHATPFLAGGARVLGTGGLSFALASSAALLAVAFEGLAAKRRKLPPAELAWGLTPVLLTAALARLVPAPVTVEGPRVMLVQPAFPQERKMRSPSRAVLYSETAALTAAGLAQAKQLGEPTPDLVAWGETMLPTAVVAPELAPALRAGTRNFPWERNPIDAEVALNITAELRQWVDEGLLGARAPRPPGILPPGTAFLSGVLHLRPMDGFVRSQNAVFLWERPGPPAGPVSKRHLVPGAETMLGLERFEGVRDTIHDIAAYVPDLLGEQGEERVLAFTARNGRRYGIGISVCFDNAFDDVFTQPLRAALRESGTPVDFHAVVSNEAWFLESQEADQMVAFSRLAAIATGRSVVRATNSGVSCVLAPDGRELARLEVGGRDRLVPGTLRVSVPVPPLERVRAATPFIHLEVALQVLWIGMGALLLGLCWRRRRRDPGDIAPASALPSPEPGYQESAATRAAGPRAGRRPRQGRP